MQPQIQATMMTVSSDNASPPVSIVSLNTYRERVPRTNPTYRTDLDRTCWMTRITEICSDKKERQQIKTIAV